MRMTLAALMVIAGVTLAVVADQPDSSEKEPAAQQLLERIEKLEKRVAALEAKQPRRVAPALPAPQLPKEWRLQPSPRDDAPSRRLPPDESVPDNWQRFEFNGQDFYIVPIDEIGRRRGEG